MFVYLPDVEQRYYSICSNFVIPLLWCRFNIYFVMLKNKQKMISRKVVVLRRIDRLKRVSVSPSIQMSSRDYNHQKCFKCPLLTTNSLLEHLSQYQTDTTAKAALFPFRHEMPLKNIKIYLFHSLTELTIERKYTNRVLLWYQTF